MKNTLPLPIIYLFIEQLSLGLDCKTQVVNKPSILKCGMDEFIGSIASIHKLKACDITKIESIQVKPYQSSVVSCLQV